MTELEVLEALLVVARSIEGAVLFLVGAAVAIVVAVVASLFKGKG
jgi:hypothetical protein